MTQAPKSEPNELGLPANRLKQKNLFLLYIVMLLVPTTRVIARHTARIAGSAAWVSPAVALALFVPVILVLWQLAKGAGGKGLARLNREVLGPVAGTVVNALYTLWFLGLSAYYLRQFADRIVSTVFHDSNSIVFVCIMLLCVAYAMRMGRVAAIRASSMFFYAIVLLVMLCMLVLVPSVDPKNLLPVSTLDTVNILAAALDIVSILAYLVVVLVFFGDVEQGPFLKGAMISSGIAFLLVFTVVFIPIGIFSASVLSNMLFPFFSAVKEIQIFGSIERVEAVIIALLILADFVIITIFAMAAQKMISVTTCTEETSPYYNMVLLLIFVGAMFFSLLSQQLNEISFRYIVPVNLAVGIGLPVVTFLVGKLRRRL